MRIASLSARPAPIEIDLDRAVLVVIDMQNDFGSDGGMFQRAGIDIAPIRSIVPKIAEVLQDARAAGLPILYTRQQHKADLSDAGSASAPHFIKHQRMQLGATFPRSGRKHRAHSRRGHLEHRDRPRTRPAPRGSGGGENPLQCVLRHRPRR